MGDAQELCGSWDQTQGPIAALPQKLPPTYLPPKLYFKSLKVVF